MQPMLNMENQSMLKFHSLCILALLALNSTFCAAADAPPASPWQPTAMPAPTNKDIKNVAPIYGQLLMTVLPSGFKTEFENVKDGHYIREAVLAGESVNKWTQMVTVTGEKGLVSNPNLTPQRFAEIKAASFHRACPTSFAARGLSDGKISEYDAFVVVLSCGTSPSIAGQTSESALIAVIKGASDYYTVQWAERTEASAKPLEIDTAKWIERFKRPNPIRLCPIVPGEVEPYASCIEKQ